MQTLRTAWAHLHTVACNAIHPTRVATVGDIEAAALLVAIEVLEDAICISPRGEARSQDIAQLRQDIEGLGGPIE